MSSEEMEGVVPTISDYPSDYVASDFNSLSTGGITKLELEEQQTQMETDEKTEDSITLDVVSWGRSDLGAIFRLVEEVTPGDEIEPLTFQGSRRIIQISSNSYHSAAVTSTGEVYICGSNEEGQVNPNRDESGNVPTYLPRPKIFDSLGQHRVCAVSCGLNHTVCVTAHGTAISFGGNECGQLGHSPKQVSKVLPRIVDFKWSGSGSRGSGSHIIQRVACGDLFTLFLTVSGEVYSCGVGENIGRIADQNSHQAERVDGMVGQFVVQVAAGASHSLAATSRGDLFAWGSNLSGQLGLPDSDSVVRIPTAVHLECSGEAVVGVAAGYAHSLCWTRNGRLLGAGSNKYGQLGGVFPRLARFGEVEVGWGLCRQASCGSQHSLAVMQASLDDPCGRGRVFGWGQNTFGQVQPSSTASLIRQPQEVALLTWQLLLYVAAGGDQSFAAGLRDGVGKGVGTSQVFGSRASLLRQFSTRASLAAAPVSAQWLLQLCGDPARAEQLPGAVADLFSSPSLLAASFVSDSEGSPLQLDVSGVEAVYKALLRAEGLLPRLLQALHAALGDVLQLCRPLLHGPGPHHVSGEEVVSEQVLRLAVIVWQCPALGLLNPLAAAIVGQLAQLLALLTPRQETLLCASLALFPAHIFGSRLLRPLQLHLAHLLQLNGLSAAASAQDPQALERVQGLHRLCEVLAWLFALNQTKELVPLSAFCNEAVSGLSSGELVHDFLSWTHSRATATDNKARFLLCNYPFLLSPQAKRRLLAALAQAEQEGAQQAAAHLALRQRQEGFMPFFLLTVRRQHLLQDALQQLSLADPLQLKKPLKVVFEGEPGVDEGGVRKEFFQLVTAQLAGPQFALLVPANDGGRTLWLNAANTWSEPGDWGLVGELLGLAVYNGVLLDLHLSPVLYRKLLGRELGLKDLQLLDPSLAAGLQQLLSYEPCEEVEEVFCRTFTAHRPVLGDELATVELVPGGADVPVTHLNRDEFVRLLVQWLLEGAVKDQFQALLTGFHRVVHPASLSLLRPDELELLMVGMPHLDLAQLRQGAVYEGWDEEHPTVKAFWEVLGELDLEDLQRFLLFATGSNKAPIGGLRDVGLRIHRMCPDSDLLPTAHTCFNTLLLPAYATKQKLKNRLAIAIRECEGFGLK